jgi:hypothetical protein
LLSARVELALQTQYEEVTEAHRPFRFLRCLQPAAVVVVAYQASKRATMEAAAAVLLGVDRALRVVQEAKETTVVPLRTLCRHSSALVAVVLALLVLTAAQCAVLAVTVLPTWL